MDELDRQVRELFEKTAFTRVQFLRAELGTCLTALDMAKFEISTGNLVFAQREVDAAEKGIDTMERFIGEIDGNEMAFLQGEVTKLKRTLDSLRQELSSYNSGPHLAGSG